MSKFLAHNPNFVRQVSQQMVYVMQPSVRINNLDSNLIAITAQFSFVYTRFLLSECHEWSAVPIAACLRIGPRGCFRSECCTAGEPMAAPRMNGCEASASLASPPLSSLRCISKLLSTNQFSTSLVLQDLFTKSFQPIAYKFRLEKRNFYRSVE